MRYVQYGTHYTLAKEAGLGSQSGGRVLYSVVSYGIEADASSYSLLHAGKAVVAFWSLESCRATLCYQSPVLAMKWLSPYCEAC